MYDRGSLKATAEAEARKIFVYPKKTGCRSKLAESEKFVAKRKKQSTDDRFAFCGTSVANSTKRK